METNQNNQNSLTGIVGGLLGDANADVNVKVKLDNDQYVYLALAMLVGVLLGSLFADVFKKILGTQ